MLTRFRIHHTGAVVAILASVGLLGACDPNVTDPPQPTTQEREREKEKNQTPMTQPDVPPATPPSPNPTPGQPASPGTGSGTQ